MFGATLTMQEMAARDKRRAYMRAYYVKNKPKFREYAERRYAEHGEAIRKNASVTGKAQRNSRDGWPIHIHKQIKYRAKVENVPFDLERRDICMPEKCPVRGTAFVFGENHPDAPSVDRVDPALGYTKGNIRVISKLANMIKSSCTDPEVFRRVALYVEGKL